MFTIRPYASTDLHDCALCFYEGFFDCPLTPDDFAFLQDYTLVLIEKSNFTFVAETDGQVVGFISGNYQPAFHKLLATSYTTYRHFGTWVQFFIKFSFKLYKLSPAFQQAFHLFYTKMEERDGMAVTACDCELAAITSRKAYRKGLGTAMVNHFMGICKRAGVKRVRLFTNSHFSYTFYDKYGFQCILTKPFLIDGNEGTSYVYEYML